MADAHKPQKMKTIQTPNHTHRQCPDPKVHLQAPIQTTGRLPQKPTPKLTATKIYYNALQSRFTKSKDREPFCHSHRHNGFESLRQWKAIKHGERKNKWIKFNAAANVQTERVLAFSLTEAEVHDSKMAVCLVEEVMQTSKQEGKKASVKGDGSVKDDAARAVRKKGKKKIQTRDRLLKKELSRELFCCFQGLV